MRACSSPSSATSKVRKRSMAGLESAHGYLQKRVAGELRLKHTPTLQFLYDDSADRGLRIAELIEEEQEERGPS